MKKRLFVYASGVLACVVLFLSVNFALHNGVETTSNVSIKDGIGSGVAQGEEQLHMPSSVYTSVRQSVQREVLGIITVQDYSGGPFRLAEEGHVVIEVDGESFSVAVKDGCFKDVGRLADQGAKVVRVVEGGGEVRIQPVDIDRETDTINIVGFKYPGFFLDVKVDDGGKPEGVFAAVDQFRNVNLGRPIHPGNSSLLSNIFKLAASHYYIPFSLNPSQVLWVTAKDKVWKAIERRGIADGSILEVVLEEGGSVHFDAVNLGVTSGLKLYVEGVGDRDGFACYRSINEGVLDISGLAEGDYVAHLSYRIVPMVGASVSDLVSFSIKAGLVVQARIEMSSGSKDGRGFLCGSLELEHPDLWIGTDEYSNLSLIVSSMVTQPSFESIGSGRKRIEIKEMKNTTGLPGYWYWEFGSIPPGKYTVFVSPIGYQEDVIVEDGMHDVFCEVRVPEPAKVILKFRDEGGLEVNGVSVGGVRKLGKDSTPIATRSKEGESEMTFVCAPGKQTLTFMRKGQPTFLFPFEFEAGWNMEVVTLLDEESLRRALKNK